jgi:hypothetical protein
MKDNWSWLEQTFHGLANRRHCRFVDLPPAQEQGRD